jgi:hypothetical protein
MSAGAASANLTVQYCMPLPNDILASAAAPAVTNARASDDYFHACGSDQANWADCDGNNGLQWNIGYVSMVHHALGLLPFKDGFYSSTNAQVGGQTVGPELHPDREAAFATLSTAMVGAMDGIGLVNKVRGGRGRGERGCATHSSTLTPF